MECIDVLVVATVANILKIEKKKELFGRIHSACSTLRHFRLISFLRKIKSNSNAVIRI